MQREVKSTGGRPKGKMETHRITIEKTGNGFSVQKHKRPVPGTSRDAMMSMMGDPDELPMSFNKHAPANKHIAAALQEMHPQLPPPGMPDAGPPDVPAAGAPPAAPGE
jgi:hypothetical protein